MADPWAEFRVPTTAPPIPSSGGADPWAEFRTTPAAAEGPGFMSRVGDVAKSAMADLPKIAGETPESRQFESALSGVMEGGMSPDVAAQMAPVPPTPGMPTHSGFARGYVTDITQTEPKAAADFLEGFSNNAPESFKAPMLSAAQKIRDYSKDITPKGYERLTNSMYDIRGLADAWNYINETAGQTVASSTPPLITGGAGFLVGGPVGAAAAAGLTSYIQNYSEVYNALKDEKLDSKTADSYAKWATIPIAGLDVLSLGTIVSRFGGAAAAKRALIDSFAKRVVKASAEAGATEAITEGGQEIPKQVAVTAATGKPLLTVDNLKAILESSVGGLIGGVTMGAGAGLVHAPTTPPTETEIGAAGAGITAPPGTPGTPLEPPTPPPVVPPVAPPTGGAVQGELPLGPPTVQGAALGQRLAGIIEPISDSMVEPSLNPFMQRGRSIVDAAASPIIAQGPLETRPQNITIPAEQIDEMAARNEAAIAEEKPGSKKAQQLAQDLEVARQEGLPIPAITVGRQVGIPDVRLPTGVRPGFNIQSIHSTTVGELVPKLDFTHFEKDSISRVIAEALRQRLVAMIPTLPVHIVTQEDLNKASASGNAAGVYFSSPQSLELPITHQGPLLVSTETFHVPGKFAETVMHESVHGVTSNVIKADPVMKEKITKLMDVAKVAWGKGWEKVYSFTNEQEFLTGVFSKETFQEFLRNKPISTKLWNELGLDQIEEKPAQAKLWDGFKGILQQVFRLPGKPKEVKSILEAAVRIGVDTMEAQAKLTQEMQAKFNKVEPMLAAVPRQEETQHAYSVLKGLRNHIEPGAEADEMARQVGYADKMNWFYKYNLHAFQLGDLNPLLGPLQRILAKAQFASTEEKQVNDAALRLMKEWVNLGRDMSGKLVGLIDDITNMVYRTQSEIQRGIGRKPTPAEFSTLVKKHGVNKAGLDVLNKINAMFDKFLDLSADLAAQEALKITDPVQRLAAVQAIRDNTRNLKSRPYFPFMRYGRHVVTVQNQAGRVIHREHFERRGVYSAAYFQNKAKAQLEKQFPAPQYQVKLDILSESSKPMIGMPGVMLDMMKQKLGLTPQQLKAFEQLRFELSPAQSYRHRLQHKSYTKGYSQDFQRSFAQYFFHGMKWYVKTKYADDMRAHIQEIKDYASNSLTPQKRLEIALYMEDWLEKGFLNPVQDFISFKAGLVFYTLAFVPMSAAVNMSQTPMVTLPYLGAKFGDVRASAALLKAIGTKRNYYRKGGLASMTETEAKALNYGIKTGRLEQTLASELAGWAQGSNLGVGYGGTGIARTLHAGMEKGMWMFDMAEKWNRRLAFMATRELALADPNNKYVQEVLPRFKDELARMMAEGFPQHEAEAILIASHVVNQTQLMTGPETRPRIMRGKLGTLLLYQKFTQGMLFLTLNNKKDFAPRFMLMALALAGLGGLPFYKDLAEIARVLAYRFYGKDFNLDREIRKLVKHMGGEDTAADQILHGSSRMGFGVPWLMNLIAGGLGQAPGVNQRMGYPSGPDLSASIGMPQIMPQGVLSGLLGPPINDPNKMFGEQSARLGGVAGQLAANFYKAIASKDPSDFKRWELVMPRALKDLSQVWRAYSTGKLAGKNDVASIQFDTRDPEHLAELLGMAGGFKPRRLTAHYEEIQAQSEAIKWYDVNRGMLLDQWVAAIRANDPEEKERVRLATQEFNAGLPPEARGFALSSDTIQKSIAMRLKSQQMMEAGLAAQKGRIPLIKNIQGLYPESTVDVRRIPR